MSAEQRRGRANYDAYLGQTPGQTLGPFFHQGLLRTAAVFQVPGLCTDASDVFQHVLVQADTSGERIAIEGVVYDGLLQPIPDACLEIWQADAQGRYRHPVDPGARDADPAFRGYGRAATDVRGAFGFQSIKPGPVAGPHGSTQAPHINLVLGARGMARHAFSRIYFEGDAALERDAVLALVPRERRRTLIARAAGQREGMSLYRFDVHLQGEDETVFFDL